MDKAKIYRIFGWLFIAIAFIYYIDVFIRAGLPQGVLQTTSENSGEAIFFVIFGFLFMLVCNVFLWVGMIFHWRADRNENASVASKWARIIKIFFALLIILFFILGFLTFEYDTFKRAREQSSSQGTSSEALSEAD